MTVFRLGDRVRKPETGQEGTVVELMDLEYAVDGEDVGVRWDDDHYYSETDYHYADSRTLELVDAVNPNPKFLESAKESAIEAIRRGDAVIFGAKLDRLPCMTPVNPKGEVHYVGNIIGEATTFTLEDIPVDSEDANLLGPYDDPEVNPNHYKFPGGAEVRDISQWLTANSAQALQYIARSSRIDGDNKGDTVADLKKAIRFLEFEIDRLENL